MTTICVAACEYPVEFLSGWTQWEEKLRRLCLQAAGAGACLLVFPEYAAVELTALIPDTVRADLPASLHALQPFREAFLAAHRTLAMELGVTILAGSFPWETGGRFVNRAWLCTPDGRTRFYDKIMMTRFEREEWFVSGGRSLDVFDIPGAVIGILICYDSEFPLLARQLCERGAGILLVPSCTDTEAGYQRVLLGCRARAMEQQCYVIHAPTSGTAPWSPALDTNTGRAGIYGPVDRSFPADGILASGAPPATAPWLIAHLSPAALHAVRCDGQVTNFADWPAQEIAAPAVASNTP